MVNEKFVDEMRMIAFGASETRLDYSLQEVCDEILKRSNEHQAIKDSLDRFSAYELLVLFNQNDPEED